jgi:hypothetical protein
MYKPTSREITIPNVKLALEKKEVARQGRTNRKDLYLMTPEASTSVRIDMKPSAVRKMKSAIFS